MATNEVIKMSFDTGGEVNLRPYKGANGTQNWSVMKKDGKTYKMVGPQGHKVSDKVIGADALPSSVTILDQSFPLTPATRNKTNEIVENAVKTTVSLNVNGEPRTLTVRVERLDTGVFALNSKLTRRGRKPLVADAT